MEKKIAAFAHVSGILWIGLLMLSVPSFAIDLVDKVLTVNVASGSRTYESDELSAITTAGSVTNIVKTGDGTLVSKDIGTYTGDFCVKDGIFAVTNSGLGSTSASTIVVEDGATVRFDIQYAVTAKKYRITGAGHGGIGALCAEKSFTLGNLALDGGTTIGGYVANSGAFKFSGNVDMNGHTLTQKLASTAATFNFACSNLQHPGDIVVLAGYFAAGSDMLDGQGHTITLADKARITRWGSTGKCNWPVICDGPHTAATPLSRFYTGGSAVKHSWLGPVVMTNGMTTRFLSTHCGNRLGPTTFAFDGPISGDGNFNAAFDSIKSLSFVELNATNTYTGTTSVGYHSLLRAKFPEAIPDYSDGKFIVPNGLFECFSEDSYGRGSAFIMDGRCETNPLGWTGPQMVAMWEKYNATAYPDASHTANVFAGAREGEDVVVTGAVFQSGIKYRIGAVGPGKLSLAAKFDNANVQVSTFGTNALHITAPWDGTAVSATPFSAFSVGGTYFGGNLVFEDAGLINFGSVNVNVGAWCQKSSWSDSGYGPARLVVKGNTVLTHTGTLGEGTSVLNVGYGWGCDGIVEVHDGAIITNRPDIGASARSVGSLLIKGGTFYSTAGGNNDNCVGGIYNVTDDAYGHIDSIGYIEVDRGQLLMRGWFHLATSAFGRGIMYVKDGLVRVDSVALNVGYNGTGLVYQTSGTLDATAPGKLEMFIVVNSSTWKGVDYRAGGRGIYTIDGSGAKTVTRTMYLSNRNDGDALLNVLAGGTLEVDDILRTTAMIKGSGNWVVTNNPAYVYFDGGILKARTANKELFGTGDNRPTRVTVGPRGAIFDTAGKNVSISAPIEATGAGGVTALALTNGPLANYHAAPLVVIRGDGTGATAVAEYDSATMSVTGVKITSPGQGYTAANTTAYIDWGGYRNNKTVPLSVTVGNPTCGGLVKRGAGTLTLKAANTFAGDVTVEGGTLKLAAEGAIPAGARVVANGGAVEVASGVTGPSTIEIGIDPATLVRGQKYVLASYPGGAPATLPSIVWTGGVAPAHWEVQMRGTDLVLAFVRGITLSFR